jgi:hypothetical protein
MSGPGARRPPRDGRADRRRPRRSGRIGRRAPRIPNCEPGSRASPSGTGSRCTFADGGLAAPVRQAPPRPRPPRPGPRPALGPDAEEMKPAETSATRVAARARPRSRPGCSTRPCSPASATCWPTRRSGRRRISPKRGPVRRPDVRTDLDRLLPTASSRALERGHRARRRAHRRGHPAPQRRRRTARAAGLAHAARHRRRPVDLVVPAGAALAGSSSARTRGRAAP